VAAIFAAMQFPYLRHIDASLEPTLVQERVCEAIAPLLASTVATGCQSDSPPTRCRGDSAPDPATVREEGRLQTPSADAVAEDQGNAGDSGKAR
jgi:hypothetical protein